MFSLSNISFCFTSWCMQYSLEKNSLFTFLLFYLIRCKHESWPIEQIITENKRKQQQNEWKKMMAFYVSRVLSFFSSTNDDITISDVAAMCYYFVYISRGRRSIFKLFSFPTEYSNALHKQLVLFFPIHILS